jgi:hypothetical protein
MDVVLLPYESPRNIKPLTLVVLHRHSLSVKHSSANVLTTNGGDIRYTERIAQFEPQRVMGYKDARDQHSAGARPATGSNMETGYFWAYALFSKRLVSILGTEIGW